MNDGTKRPVTGHPVRGHFFDRSYLHLIFEDPQQGQYYIQPKTKCPIYQQRLPEGKDWAELSGYCCCLMNADRIALHEAGHAAMCCLEGIRMEYVTIEPSDTLADFIPGSAQRQKDGGGLCQWTYDIIARRHAKNSQGLYDWCEREVKMLLGGVLAEKQQYGADATPIHDLAWSEDQVMVSKRTEFLAQQSGRHPDEEFGRLAAAVQTSFTDDATWQGVCRIKEALVTRGAIPGRDAEKLFKCEA